MKTLVQISRTAQKGYSKAPAQVQDKFLEWVELVQRFGLETIRLRSGFHDEPLDGKRKGQRSIRLNKQWRAFYTAEAGKPVLVTVLEVNAHDYRTK